MSLQEIEKSHIIAGDSSQGIDRGIDASSQKMVLDILQVTQYSKPIESSVRELASNAVDAQREKEIAIEILTGKAQVSDYFIDREGEQYEASKFKKEYFDLNHLDGVNNHVEIRYEEGEGAGFCDTFSVLDYGVGIGPPRLAGVFSLGYSTKRNTAQALGAYGLGAKSALSTGVPVYTMETVHNGKKFLFNCYAYRIDSLTPKFNMSDGTVNPTMNIANPGQEDFIVYYTPTEEKNYTKISFGVKRHNRPRFINAVKHQLLYFKGVKFFYKKESRDDWEDIPFLAEVQHNSSNLLVSDTHLFSRPHVVVVKEKGSSFGVTYGTVDFQELEMESYFGSIGFKCPIRAVVRDPRTGEETVLQPGISVTPRI